MLKVGRPLPGWVLMSTSPRGGSVGLRSMLKSTPQSSTLCSRRDGDRDRRESGAVKEVR